MLGRLVVLVVAAGCGRVGFDASRDGAMSFDASPWSEHVSIDIGSPATEEVRDVPILVRLDPSRIDYALAAADGRDLRFTDGGVELAHEIEHWDPGGTSIVWVRVPRLASSPARTTLAMHYGNSTATALDGDATWGTEYAGVYHFAGGVNDATSTHLDARLIGTGSFPELSLLGPALALSGTAGHAVIENVGALDDVVTFSLWMRSESPSGTGIFEGGIVWPYEGTVEDSPYLGFNEDNVFFETVDADGRNEGRTIDLVPIGQWVHLALVWRSTTVETYIDGQPSVTIVVPNGPLRPLMPMYFGADCSNCPAGTTAATNDFLDGALDEIRLERVPRTAAWFAVQYASMRDTLIDWP
jgi:hypothetical protein